MIPFSGRIASRTDEPDPRSPRSEDRQRDVESGDREEEKGVRCWLRLVGSGLAVIMLRDP